MIVKTNLAHPANYLSGEKNKRALSAVKYIVVHYTANDGDSDEGNAAYFARSAGLNASAHYFVDDDSVTQSVPDDYVAWHCGAKAADTSKGGGKFFNVCSNANSIGVETCDTLKDGKYAVQPRTYLNLVELVKSLMGKYKIPVENVIRHYDVTGKVCPAWWVGSSGSANEKAWGDFKAALSGAAGTSPVASSAAAASGLTAIAGKTVATAAQMSAYIRRINPSAPDIAALYIAEGAAEGIRGDMAFAQACIETGNFLYAGSAVTPDQHNYCGLGVTQTGVKGSSFASAQIGVRAQIQHLKAYANAEPLKAECVDPRFKYVERGVAPYVEWLGIAENPKGKGWAGGAGYGAKILKILAAIIAAASPPEQAAPTTPEKVTVDNAAADGIITDKAHWLRVLTGKTPPNPAYIKIVMDNVHNKLLKLKA